MKGIFIILIVGLVIAGVVVLADELLLSNGGEVLTTYNYVFPSDIKFCDLHWLRPAVHYQMGLYPDYITATPPDVEFGFTKPLTAEQDTILRDIVSHAKDNCNEPQGATYEFKFRINPDLFVSNLATASVSKPFYFSDGENMTLLFFNPLTDKEKTDIQTQLCKMWVEKAK